MRACVESSPTNTAYKLHNSPAFRGFPSDSRRSGADADTAHQRHRPSTAVWDDPSIFEARSTRCNIYRCGTSADNA